MNAYGGRPLAAAKRELIQSISSLTKLIQFQIIFYNEFSDVFDPTGSGRLFFASEANKEAASKFIARVEASGNTGHFQPLLKAVGLGGDNIFFLTDGTEPSLTGSELNRIRRRNGGRAAIHVIQFGSEPQIGDNWLKKLARENGGEDRFYRIDRLSATNP